MSESVVQHRGGQQFLSVEGTHGDCRRRIRVDADAYAAGWAQHVPMGIWSERQVSVYSDRREAGLVLADHLRNEHLEGGVVVGLARGGVVVAAWGPPGMPCPGCGIRSHATARLKAKAAQ